MTNRTPAAPRPAAARRGKAAKAAPEPAAIPEPIPEPAPEPAPEAVVAAAPAEDAPLIPPAVEVEAESAPLPEIKLGKKKDRKKDKKKDKKAKKAKKEAVLIRFDDSQLAAVDVQAETLGLSRAAWVRMVVAKALAAG